MSTERKCNFEFDSVCQNKMMYISSSHKGTFSSQSRRLWPLQTLVVGLSVCMSVCPAITAYILVLDRILMKPGENVGIWV